MTSNHRFATGDLDCDHVRDVVISDPLVSHTVEIGRAGTSLKAVPENLQPAWKRIRLIIVANAATLICIRTEKQKTQLFRWVSNITPRLPSRPGCGRFGAAKNQEK
jgi:hypothetical protein